MVKENAMISVIFLDRDIVLLQAREKPGRIISAQEFYIEVILP